MMAALGTVVGVAALVVVGDAQPAAAKGANMYSAADRHEPGDTATLIGYTTGGHMGDPEDEGPFHAYLLMEAGSWPRWEEAESDPAVTLYDADDIPLGPIEVTETEAWGQPALRASLTFQVPADLAPGEYNVLVCGDPCTSTGPGDLLSGYIAVGVDPFYTIERVWPPDEPAVAQLPDDATLISSLGNAYTAGDVRAGLVDETGESTTTTSVTARTNQDDETASQSRRAARASAADGNPDENETDGAGIVPWLLGAGLLGAVGASTTVWRARRHGAVAAATSSSTAVDGGGGGGDDDAVGRRPGA